MGGFGKNNFYGNNNKGGRRIPFVLVIERYIFSSSSIIFIAIRRVNEMKYFVCISYVRSSGEVFHLVRISEAVCRRIEITKTLGGKHFIPPPFEYLI